MAVETLDTRALRMLSERIDEELRRRAEIIVLGTAQSFEAYKEASGFLRGLEAAKGLCVEVERDLYGKD